MHHERRPGIVRPMNRRRQVAKIEAVFVELDRLRELPVPVLLGTAALSTETNVVEFRKSPEPSELPPAA